MCFELYSIDIHDVGVKILRFYALYHHVLSSGSRSRKTPKWMKRLQIIDSTTITLFSNLLFKGVGRHPKTGKKKGGIKAHAVIHANEGVPSDIKFISAATNDSFMLKPATLNKGDMMAMDRAYIDYGKFQQLTERGVIYVPKMKKNLKYSILSDTMYQTSNGLMEVRIQHVEFEKQQKGGDVIRHRSRIITYADIKKRKLISLLTNDMESDYEEIIPIYHKRWENRAAVQADETELPLEKLLWRKRKRHQDLDMGDSYSQLTSYGHAERIEATMEFYLSLCRRIYRDRV